MATPLVKVTKELQGTETVYSIEINVHNQAVYLKPETMLLVVSALNKLIENTSLDYKKKKHECTIIPIWGKVGT